MRWPQLCGMLRARAKRRGIELVVEVCPWPDRGSVEQVGSMLYVTVDSRQSAGDRLESLAHEAGHILFGHYAMEEGIWTLVPARPGCDDQWETEADYFAMFAQRSRAMPAEWIIGGQLDLL